jgi:hypothetical protein
MAPERHARVPVASKCQAPTIVEQKLGVVRVERDEPVADRAEAGHVAGPEAQDREPAQRQLVVGVERQRPVDGLAPLNVRIIELTRGFELVATLVEIDPRQRRPGRSIARLVDDCALEAVACYQMPLRVDVAIVNEGLKHTTIGVERARLVPQPFRTVDDAERLAESTGYLARDVQE